MKPRIASGILVCVAASLLAACGTTPNTGTFEEREALHADALTSLSEFRRLDDSLQPRLDSAHAYAIFPKVVSGAVGVGGAHGKGEVYQAGQLIGYADMSQGSIGVQLGAQRYAELILFENDRALTEFKNSTVEFDARASAVAASKGAAATANYTNGVMVFSMPETGLMFQAAIGGQKFRFTPYTR
jgi:lipid-binding SYLF domain-containing protein